MQYLKNEARKLGANAIIKLQCSSYNSSTGQYVPIAGTAGVGYLSSYACPKCEGIAVIFNNKEQK